MIAAELLHRARILLVDDQELSNHILSQLLASAGYTDVSSTCDGASVAELHRRHAYDLIVLDLQMPDMDGFQVLEALYQIEADQYLPVLVLSAHYDSKLAALEAGAKDFLTKPYDPGELLSRIRNLLEVRLLYNDTRAYGLRMASYDSLTGLPNRQLFSQSLATQLAAAQPHPSALLLIDLDNFTSLNDTQGYPAGDGVLRLLAQRLNRLAPPRASLARFGNDEFALLLPALEHSSDCGRIVALIKAAMHEPFPLPEGRRALSVSMGVALYPDDAVDAATLIRYANIALHQAKQSGSNQCSYFTYAMNEQAQHRYQLEQALRHACACDEFELYYQPKVHLRTGRMVGTEALLRWNRPGHGVVSPAEFIPLLEQTGMIREVGAWVIEQACRQIAQWAADDAGPLPVAVNVASHQFSTCTLVDTVAEALARHRIDPALLSLEVTETALMEDLSRTAATLSTLWAMGVRIAIDDFGTGYSSLAYLRRFPVDTLKIDIAFIRELPHNTDDAAVVRAIIAMAHSLKLKVVAEGVETAEQLTYLAEHGCDVIQGYYFSRPIPAEMMTQLLRQDARLAYTPAGSA
ncbi:EAL domain-containing protein [Duganella fentianensis]|uniref:putative bifunctional diguanylate cyclase/phosphodiesterase n=1 Tax=Duganella fentianensis TaxID=2692177 RepID=UPI0032B2DB42